KVRAQARVGETAAKVGAGERRAAGDRREACVRRGRLDDRPLPGDARRQMLQHLRFEGLRWSLLSSGGKWKQTHKKRNRANHLFHGLPRLSLPPPQRRLTN